jgi:hypothetical protein
MSSTLLDTALDVFPRMLEETAFLFIDQSEGTPAFDSDTIGVGISCDGPEAGELRLWAQASFLRKLSANMLGIEEEDPMAIAKGRDALGELLNIVLGHCLTERFGEAENCRMGIPRVVESSDLQEDILSGSWLNAEGEPLLVSWKPLQ